jgi:hypothetical protein
MKKVFYTLIALVAIIAIILFVGSKVILPNYLADLETTVKSDAAKMGYIITYDHLEWGVISPGVNITNLKVAQIKIPGNNSTDESAVDQLNESPADSIFRFNVDKLDVKISLMNILSGEYTSISRFEASDGELIVFKSDLFLKTPPDTTAGKYQEDRKYDFVEIDRFEVQNLHYQVLDNPMSLHLDQLQGSVKVDMGNDMLRITIPRNDLSMGISQISKNEIFHLHRLEIDTVSYNMSRSRIEFSGLNIRPNQNRAIINYEQPHMLTHTSVSAPSITGTGFEWTYDSTFAFSLNHLDINRMFLNLYQNMDKPISDKKKTLPTAWISETKLDFIIDSITVRNSRLNYTENKTRETLNPANFWMDEWNLTWTGYGTNDRRPDSHEVSSTMLMMDGAQVNVRISFPYSAAIFGFKVDGAVGQTQFDVFNPVLEPLEGFHFRSGILNEAQFKFEANDLISSGSLFIKFDDVGIGLSRDPKLRDRVLAWAANRFVIQDSSDGESMEIELGMEREQNRSFVNYLAQILKNGLVEALQK